MADTADFILVKEFDRLDKFEIAHVLRKAADVVVRLHAVRF